MRTNSSKRGSFGKQFMQVFPETMIEIGQDKTNGGAALKIYFWASTNLSWKTWKSLTQAEVGEQFGLSASSVGRALKFLADKGLLERRGSGPRQEWRLTPEGGWMGTAAQYQRELRDRGDNPAGLKVVSDRETEGAD